MEKNCAGKTSSSSGSCFSSYHQSSSSEISGTVSVDPMSKLHAGHLGPVAYGEVIRSNVRRKWTTPEQKEWWYSKFTMSRRKKLVKLFKQQNGICIFCGCETWLAQEGVKKQNPPPGMLVKQMATADHKIPQFHGGTDRMANLVMACTRCNSDRQIIPFEEFMEIRQNPEKWKKHKSKLAVGKNERDRKRAIRSNYRLQQRVLQLAMVMLFRPDLVEDCKDSLKQKDPKTG